MQPDDRRHAIAAEVRAELSRQHMTHSQLGEIIGVDQGAATLRIRGARSFRAEELAKVADWLGVPVSNFFPVAERAA